MEEPNQKPTITEGGLRQWVKEARQIAGVGKGNLRAWKHKINKLASGLCECGEEEETGEHVIFKCKRWEEL